MILSKPCFLPLENGYSILMCSAHIDCFNQDGAFHDGETIVWYNLWEFSLSWRANRICDLVPLESMLWAQERWLSLRLSYRAEAGGMTMSSRLAWSSVRPYLNNNKNAFWLTMLVCLVYWIDKVTISFQVLLHMKICFASEPISVVLTEGNNKILAFSRSPPLLS